MVKLAMTPRVGAGTPVDALLFETRLNGEARSNFEAKKRMRTHAEKNRIADGHWDAAAQVLQNGIAPLACAAAYGALDSCFSSTRSASAKTARACS